MTALAMGGSRAEEGQGTVRPAIGAAVVPAAKMACGMDQGTSIFWRGATSRKTGQQTLVARRPGRWRTPLVPLPVARVAADPLLVPGAEVNGNPPSPTPTLAYVVGMTGEGDGGKDVIVLVAIVVGRGVKTINN
jgi:hypothetical protein